MRQIGQTRFLPPKIHSSRDLHISIVVLNAALAKLVQARPYDAGVLINARANLAEQGRVLDRLK